MDSIASWASSSPPGRDWNDSRAEQAALTRTVRSWAVCSREDFWPTRMRSPFTWPSRSIGMLMVAILVLGGVPHAAHAQDQSVHPGANQKYFDQDLGVWKQIFENASREIVVRQKEILAALDLQPGMVVADVGAGTGLFTFPFARKVGPKGKVYAIDIVPKFVAHIEAQKRRRRAGNVVVLLGKEREVPLAEASVDFLFLCDVYHHFEYPQDMNRSLFRSLRPGGSLVVIDFKRVPGKTSAHILEHVRAGAAEVTREIEAAGFEKAAELPLLEQNYFLRFRKPPARRSIQDEM